MAWASVWEGLWSDARSVLADWLRDEVSDADPTPDVDAWTAWRPSELSARLANLDVPWAIAAGWAIDLFVGGAPRVHEDIEMVVGRTSFPAVRAVLSELDWYGAGGLEGEQRSVWPIDEAPDELHQTWGWDRQHGCWRLDVFREPWEDDTWVCRRDPSIRRPVTEAIESTRDGVPYLAPEIVLLFKARGSEDGRYWARTSDPQLVELVLSQLS